jgi:hypothetical protein
MEFTFSVWRDVKEYWFQIFREDVVDRIVKGEVHKLGITLPS